MVAAGVVVRALDSLPLQEVAVEENLEMVRIFPVVCVLHHNYVPRSDFLLEEHWVVGPCCCTQRVYHQAGGR